MRGLLGNDRFDLLGPAFSAGLPKILLGHGQSMTVGADKSERRLLFIRDERDEETV
jgi:hypothetical protein